MGDNGKESEGSVKTEEQLETERIEAKKARFAESPDSFIEIGEIVAAAIRVKDNEGRTAISYVNGPASRFEIALVRTEIVRRIDKLLDLMDLRQEQMEKKHIITAHKPGIRDIFRGKR